MKVRCINDDWGNPRHEVIDRILQVGDDCLLPKKGEVYEVVGYGHWDRYEFPNGDIVENVKAYELDIESSENYGAKLLFSKERFEVVDDEFVPNYFDKDFGLCKKMNMFASFTFKLPEGNKPPESET